MTNTITVNDEVIEISHEIVPVNMTVLVESKQERIDELVRQVSDLHDSINDGKSEMEEMILQQSNNLRKAGLYLIELKEHTKNASFQTLFASMNEKSEKPQIGKKFNFNIETAKMYMRFAKKWQQHELELNDVRGKKNTMEILVASETINNKSKSGEKLHNEPSVTELFINFQMDWNDFMGSVNKVSPVSEWDEATIAKVKRQIQPIVDFYNNL